MDQRDRERRQIVMKRTLVVFVAALVAAGVALAAVTRQDAAAGLPTTASLMPAYVQAAKYWSARTPASAIPSPPTTASLMPAYVQAGKVWRR
jgi:hypothetical protein